MRKLLPILVLLLTSPCWATFGACWGTNDNASSSTTITVSASPTGGTGHELVGFARFGSTSPTSITFSDIHNTWTSRSTIASDTSEVAQIATAPNVTGGTYTITATASVAAAFDSIVVCEYSGIASTTEFDVAAKGTCTGQVSSCTTAAFTTTNANDQVVVMATQSNTGQTWTAGLVGGNTAVVRTSNDNDSGVEDTTFSATQTSITAAMSASLTGTWDIFAVALKTSGGAAAPSGFNKRQKIEQMERGL